MQSLKMASKELASAMRMTLKMRGDSNQKTKMSKVRRKKMRKVRRKKKMRKVMRKKKMRKVRRKTRKSLKAMKMTTMRYLRSLRPNPLRFLKSLILRNLTLPRIETDFHGTF